MNFRRLSALSILFAIHLFLFSCSDEDVHKAGICLPIKGTFNGGYIVYEYDTSEKLKRVLYYVNNHFEKVDDLGYDNMGRLTDVKRKYIDLEMVYETYQLSYNADGKPQTLQMWGQAADFPPTVTNFSYDAKGRLVSRVTPSNTVSITYRYEYDDNDNVMKVFFRSHSNQDEFLGRENLSFDNHPRFYAASPDLEALNIYIFNFEPSKNNPLTSTVTWITPGSGFASPVDLKYMVTYNEKALVKSLQLSIPQTFPDFVFDSLEYNCK